MSDHSAGACCSDVRSRGGGTRSQRCRDAARVAGKTVTMKLADGTTRNIARAEIDELVTSNRSFMPEGVEETVSVDQMRDLIAFLRGGL